MPVITKAKETRKTSVNNGRKRKKKKERERQTERIRDGKGFFWQEILSKML